MIAALMVPISKATVIQDDGGRIAVCWQRIILPDLAQRQRKEKEKKRKTPLHMPSAMNKQRL